MHVLSNPEHHASRRKWAKYKEQCYPELTNEIKELSELTDSWVFIIDSEKWKEIRQMEIVEMISFFRKKNIYQWREWVKYPIQMQMGKKEKDRILDVVERYYEVVYRKEEMVLRPFLLRILREEKEKCQMEGLWNWCGKIHPRLNVEKNTIIYKKKQEYRYEKQEIKTVFITVSSFVYPHLWLYKNEQSLEIVKGIIVESMDDDIPEEFVKVFRALGNKTRLIIIKLLLQEICTTQALAKEMQLSEAVISKHLKIMWQAGLVRKVKKGFYMEYKFEIEMIDYIPYRFYETLMF